MNQLELAVSRYESAVVESLQQLVRINSVLSEEKPGMPFGEGPAKALESVLALCEKLGFRTKNLDNFVGYAEVGQGEEMLGILTHMDVVPEGTGWIYPPYNAVIADGKLFGRGTIDDKGPAIAAIYAVKAVMDAGIPLTKRIRILFGADEETGWRDMDHYMEAGEEVPTYSFAPDANFPVIFAEKGCLYFDLTMDAKEAGILSIAGGTASNAVPESCEIQVLGKDGIPVTVIAEGVAAHASLPEQGENAISKAMEELYTLDVSGTIRCPLASFYHEKIGMDYLGTGFGIAGSDESGCLTWNVGTATVADGKLRLSVDIRYPVTWDSQKLLNTIIAQAGEYGLAVEDAGTSAPLYMPKDSELIRKLMVVYRSITGDESEPLAIGGGTFARAMPNAVAFGPLLPGRPMTEHQKDEYILLEDLKTTTRIYAHAVAAILE